MCVHVTVLRGQTGECRTSQGLHHESGRVLLASDKGILAPNDVTHHETGGGVHLAKDIAGAAARVVVVGGAGADSLVDRKRFAPFRTRQHLQRPLEHGSSCRVFERENDRFLELQSRGSGEDNWAKKRRFGFVQQVGDLSFIATDCNVDVLHHTSRDSAFRDQKRNSRVGDAESPTGPGNVASRDAVGFDVDGKLWNLNSSDDHSVIWNS